MEPSLVEIREAQRASWNKFSPGWKKWDKEFMEFLRPMGEKIISLIHPEGTDYVLDIAAGTGEPGITIAQLIPNGKVLITDLAEDMLVIAKAHADMRNLTNVDFIACDVSNLPFEDNTFDAISCRLGFMFFPDMLLAAREMARVLKPGGRIATSVWSTPDKNFWVTAIGGTINRNMQLPAPPPDAPGMFRCAQPGLIEGLFKEAGLKQIEAMEVNGILKCGMTEVYWNMMTDIAAPFVAALDKADEAMKEKIKTEVFDLVNQKYPAGMVNIEATSIIIYGEK